MKTTLLISIIISLVLFSCNSNVDADKITGNWKITSFKANIPELNPEIIKLGEEEALSTNYLFRKDHSFQMISAIFPKGIKGKWEIDQQQNMLTLTAENSENTKPQIQKIIYLDSQNMQWEQTLEGLGTIRMALERTTIAKQ